MNYATMSKVYKALCRCKGAYATVRAVADLAKVSEDEARKYLNMMNDSGLADVVRVIDDKHGARRHRCSAYALKNIAEK